MTIMRKWNPTLASLVDSTNQHDEECENLMLSIVTLFATQAVRYNSMTNNMIPEEPLPILPPGSKPYEYIGLFASG